MPAAEAERAQRQMEKDVARLSEDELNALLEAAGLPDQVLIPKLIIYEMWRTFTETYRVSATEDEWRRFYASMERHARELTDAPIDSVFSNPYDRELDRRLLMLLRERMGIETIADLCRQNEQNLRNAGFDGVEVKRIQNVLYNAHGGKLRLMG